MEPTPEAKVLEIYVDNTATTTTADHYGARDDTVSGTPGDLDHTALLESYSSSGQAPWARGLPSLQELISRASSSLSLSRRHHSSRKGTFASSKSMAERGLWGLHFVNAINLERGGSRDDGWAAVEGRFEDHKVNGFLPRTHFGLCIGISKKHEEEYALELYDTLARRRGMIVSSGNISISLSQLRDFWEQLTHQGFQSRLQLFFDLVDTNVDGRITKDEVEQILSLSASTNQLSKIKERADEYATFIMEELDPHDHGYIEIHTLEMLLLQVPEESSDIVAHTKKLSQHLERPGPLKKRWVRKLIYFVGDNWKRVWVILLWLCVCAALFAWKFIQFRRHYIFHVVGYCVCVAKGGVEVTKLNMALILLPVCRNTLTWLRGHTTLGSVLPFDQSISFHKVVSTGIVVGTGLHVVAHMTCNFPRLLHASNEAYEPLRRFFGEKKPSNYWWFVKGTEGWTGLVMMALMFIAYAIAMAHTMVRPFIRRKKLNPPKFVAKLIHLKAFWYSHHLFVIVYALYIVHGHKLYLQTYMTWMYVAVPMALYACERLIQSNRAHYRKKVDILESRSKVLPPDDVLALFMTKPKGFTYTSGQYILIKCPQISRLEWHPFTLTSAPGDDYLSVHIRKAGKWTTRMLTHFPSTPESGVRGDNVKEDHTPRKIKVEIDGPYSAPAQDYKDYDVLLLVGLGIGVTPFISILKDMFLHNHQNLEPDDIESGTRGVKKAYLYWSAREPECFGWFSEAMNHMAEHHAVEIHNHCTSVYEKGDARSALVALLQSLHHAKTGVDVFSGNKVKTRFGRPRWPQVFDKLANDHRGQRVGMLSYLLKNMYDANLNS